MQDGQEDSARFVKKIKEKVHDWKSRHLWATRISAFIFLLLFFSFVVLTYANFYRVHTNVASARYMLSALVQSQAAIIAIVISLTLIAVQLTASAYSPRVISIFRHSYGWQALFVLYGISIFYGLLVLKMIKGADDLSPITYLDISLEGHISIAYALGCLTFAMLIMYLQSIINFLNPASIIKRLAKEITKDKILNSKEDPIQPIMDIIHGSIMKYDFGTTRVGLRAVAERAIVIIDLDGEEEISRCFCDYLRRVSRLAVSKMDEESTVEVIENLENFGKSTAEKGLEYAVKQAARTIEGVGARAFATRKELEYVAWKAAESLGDVGSVAVENELESATILIVGALERIGKTATEKVFEDVVDRVVESLGLVGEAAAEKKLDRATRQAAQCLGFVGTFAATKEFKRAISNTVFSLGLIGKIAAKKGLEIATQQAAMSLAELTLPSEEVVKTAIRKYEYELKEQDRDSFQKFMKLYEQELEKLRAKK
jgi:hypothetical protein